MKRGTKIAIAIVACLAIWFVFAIANAAAGNRHGGGVLVMMIMFSILAFVWRKITGKKEDEESATLKLHSGTGENRYDFEVQLTQEEILRMSKTREQDPERWKDNEYELVKAIKPDFRIDELENSGKKSQAEPAKDTIQTIKLLQDGIEVTMSLPANVIEQMDVLRKQDPQKWMNKEVELVREAKKQAKAIPIIKEDEDGIEKVGDFESDKQTEAAINAEVETAPIETKLPKEESPKSRQKIEATEVPIKEEPKPVESLFGNKLESEYRRESKAESHWIRQDDTEICINIEDDVYRKMVELQSENPKKWVNKELDLFKKAKSLLLEQGSPKRFMFRRK